MTKPNNQRIPTCVYVLTGGSACGVAPYLAAVSVGCLRIVHPEARITLLTDLPTAQILKSGHSFLLDRLDAVKAIETGTADPVIANRFLKTQLPRYLEGPCLYLDNDTVPLRPLSAIYDPEADFAASPDVQGRGIRNVCPPQFRELYRTMGWAFPPRWYLNGGVFCVGDSVAARQLMEDWHQRWLRSTKAGIPLDQPALNSLFVQTSARVRVLPQAFNALIEVDENLAKGAYIYHYTTSYARLSTYRIPELIALLSRNESILDQLHRLVSSRYIWQDESHARRQWNTGNFFSAIMIATRKGLASLPLRLKRKSNCGSSSNS